MRKSRQLSFTVKSSIGYRRSTILCSHIGVAQGEYGFPRLKAPRKQDIIQSFSIFVPNFSRIAQSEIGGRDQGLRRFGMCDMCCEIQHFVEFSIPHLTSHIECESVLHLSPNSMPYALCSTKSEIRNPKSLYAPCSMLFAKTKKAGIIPP